MTAFLNAYERHVQALAAQGLRRELPDTGQRWWADFSSNDYLGLSRHPRVIDAAHAALDRYGTGATGSRLLSGNLDLYEAFEARIAADKHAESALIFGAGYQANATVLAALVNAKVLGAEPLVFADRLNHASLHHAFRLTGVRQLRFRHADLAHLRALLEQHAHGDQPKFIVAESVFGMDGDALDVPALAALAREHGALLYLDEAHATGVLGERGYGLTAAPGARVDVAMGTFSKALGGSGAYIACPRAIKDYLVNTCTGFIYSTALSPVVVAAMQAAWTLLPTLDAERARLQQMAADLRARLQARGFDTGASSTHIVPVILGDEARALRARDALRARGINVSAVRPPTVPPHTARLRLALNTGHTPAHLDALVEALASV
ncbi:aminotransferase class I/II-fold pyridoxal phosphate-dependent enzyme [Aquabacterium sp.]|uniref:aminotransferase class I/II-fold pyridoxal phosphate-dependent enzyme n=1 Tax=Aquabacterium sp. TaxID=1872578 RepID=UPI0035B310AD